MEPQPSSSASPDIVGTWSEHWADVNHRDNIHINWVNGNLHVSIDPVGKYNLTVLDEKFENGVLSFRVRGGAYGWEYFYTATPTRQSRYTANPESNRMELTIIRKAYLQKQTFAGELFR
jgi:hypothetical protein